MHKKCSGSQIANKVTVKSYFCSIFNRQPVFWSNNKENVHDIKKVMINWLILDRNLATISSVNISCITFTLTSFSSLSFKDNITIFHSFAWRLHEHFYRLLGDCLNTVCKLLADCLNWTGRDWRTFISISWAPVGVNNQEDEVLTLIKLSIFTK